MFAYTWWHSHSLVLIWYYVDPIYSWYSMFCLHWNISDSIVLVRCATFPFYYVDSTFSLLIPDDKPANNSLLGVDGYYLPWNTDWWCCCLRIQFIDWYSGVIHFPRPTIVTPLGGAMNNKPTMATGIIHYCYAVIVDDGRNSVFQYSIAQ